MDAEYLAGLKLALKGDWEGATAAFERSRGRHDDVLAPALNLLDGYQRLGRMDEAAALAEEVLKRWPDEHHALLAVARLRERQGRPNEALELMRHAAVNSGPDSIAYPTYLRLLIENRRWDEAAIEARWAFQQPSSWIAPAQLTQILTLFHAGEHQRALGILEQLNVAEYISLLDDWATCMHAAGAIEEVRQLLTDAMRVAPNNGKLVILHRQFSNTRGLLDDVPVASLSHDRP